MDRPCVSCLNRVFIAHKGAELEEGFPPVRA